MVTDMVRAALPAKPEPLMTTGLPGATLLGLKVTCGVATCNVTGWDAAPLQVAMTLYDPVWVPTGIIRDVEKLPSTPVVVCRV
ncbi:MAG: hypothetical protein NVS2B16_29780 [Chloroflexota bacterium]